MVHIPLMFLSEWLEFSSAPCLAGGEGGGNLMTARVSMLLKSRTSPDLLPFNSCNKKSLAVRHINRPLFPTTLFDFVLRHREVGRAKDLSSHFWWTYMSTTLARNFTSVAAFLQNAFLLFKKIKTSRPEHQAP